MKNLVSFSRKYGSDPNLVLAGGGNTSMKENGTLYVKGSGCALATMNPEDFVAMDRDALLATLKKDYPKDDKAREAEYLADVLATRLPGEENKRPSVEALLHAIFPQRYVLHLHPARVNGLTCAIDGEKHTKRLFPKAVWVPACRPGYTLAKLLSDSMEEGTNTVLLENHGVFFAADTEEGLADLLNSMMDTLKAETGEPEITAKPELSKPFTPDHVVYCGLGPNLPDTDNARLLYQDACKIATYAESFGGPKPMSEDLTNFISNWEAEAYRKSQK